MDASTRSARPQWWVAATTGGSARQQQTRRLTSRVRFLAAAAANPALRAGPPIMLGPRSSWRFGPDGSLTRGPGLVVEADFTGAFFAPATIGSSVFINRGAYLAVYAGLTLGDGVRFGEGVSVHDEDHAVGPDGRDGFVVSPIEVGAGAWIGAGATLLRGTVIGEGAVVAAGAVVRGPGEAGTTVAGVPARPVTRRSRPGVTP